MPVYALLSWCGDSSLVYHLIAWCSFQQIQQSLKFKYFTSTAINLNSARVQDRDVPWNTFGKLTKFKTKQYASHADNNDWAESDNRKKQSI